MTPIPIQVIEAVTGALLAAFICMAAFMMLYLSRAWRESHVPGMRFYTYENKAAIALAMVACGMALNVFAAWWSIHRRIEQHPEISVWLTAVYIVGGLQALWGLLCLLRALSRYDWPSWRWAVLSIIVLCCGLLPVLMPWLLPV